MEIYTFKQMLISLVITTMFFGIIILAIHCGLISDAKGSVVTKIPVYSIECIESTDTHCDKYIVYKENRE